MTSNFLDRSKLFKEEQPDISDESEISDTAVHKHIMYTINEFYKSSMRFQKKKHIQNNWKDIEIKSILILGQAEYSSARINSTWLFWTAWCKSTKT